MDNTGEYKISNHSQKIMGEDHILVERADGFQFYLDEIFLYTLKNITDEKLYENLISKGINQDQIGKIFIMLKGAGLIENDD